MCFFSQISKDAVELQHRFNAKFEEGSSFKPMAYNAFQFPKTPVITDKNRELIQMFQWGLIPHWAKNDEIKKNTLNARVETIHEKPSYKYALQNRCLILSDGFYEWQWLDSKGKQKQKYLITLPDNQLFAFAGLYNTWADPSTGEMINTYTILTTEANELMSIIHNSKKRMPLILNPEDEYLWLSGEKWQQKEIQLVATPLSL
jgi:putative SOS response-associated peptidase YedK